METLFWVLAGLLFIAIVLFLISLVYGLFGNRVKIEVNYLRKELRSKNIDPNRFDAERLEKLAESALNMALYGQEPIGKYNSHDYLEELKKRIDIIAECANGHDVHQDFKTLIDVALGENWLDDYSASSS